MQNKFEIPFPVQSFLYTSHDFIHGTCSKCGVQLEEFQTSGWPCKKEIEKCPEVEFLLKEISSAERSAQMTLKAFLPVTTFLALSYYYLYPFSALSTPFGMFFSFIFAQIFFVFFLHRRSNELKNWFRIEELRKIESETKRLLEKSGRTSYTKLLDNFSQSLFKANAKIPRILKILRENPATEILLQEDEIRGKIRDQKRADPILDNTLEKILERKQLIFILIEKVDQFILSKQNAIETIRVLKMKLEIDANQIIDGEIGRVFEEISLLSKVFNSVEKAIN